MPTIALIWICAFGLFFADASPVIAGEHSDPRAQIFELTSSNRHYPGIMFGGWGPHLRAPMRNSRNELWFVTDAGPDVQHDEQIVYHRFDGKQWSEAARVTQIAGVQQNVASVMSGDVICSYGISVREPLYVEQCKFDTGLRKLRSCAPIEIKGKPLVLPANCNYVGAAVGPDGNKIVWWTTVGVSGGEGKWSYIYEQNNSWAGPVVSTLNGYNDFGYVFASFSSNSVLAVAGQLFKGAYPAGTYAVGCAEFRFGDKLEYAKNFYALNTNVANCGRSAADICVLHDDTYVVAETQQGKLACYYKPAVKNWMQCDSPVCVLTNIHRARFSETAKNFYLITGSADGSGLNVRGVSKSSAGAIDWSQMAPVRVPVPATVFAEPSAIYVESRSYQTREAEGLNFSIVGHYPEADAKILSVQFTR